MIDVRLLIPILASFFLTLILIPSWIRKAHQINLLWNDMNKTFSQKVAGSGGIIVVLGFVFGIFLFIAYRVFYVKSFDFLVETLALLVVVLLLAGIGFVDDLLGWQRGGLSGRSRLAM